MNSLQNFKNRFSLVLTTLILFSACSSETLTIRNSSIYTLDQFRKDWVDSKNQKMQLDAIEKVEKTAAVNFDWKQLWVSFSAGVIVPPRQTPDSATIHEHLIRLHRFDCSHSSFDSFAAFAIQQFRKRAPLQDLYFESSFGSKKMCETWPSLSLSIEALKFLLANADENPRFEITTSTTDSLSRINLVLAAIRGVSSNDNATDEETLHSLLKEVPSDTFERFSSRVLTQDLPQKDVLTYFEAVSQITGTFQFSGDLPTFTSATLGALFRGPNTLRLALSRLGLNRVIRLMNNLTEGYFLQGDKNQISQSLQILTDAYETQSSRLQANRVEQLKQNYRLFTEILGALSRADIEEQLEAPAILERVDQIATAFLSTAARSSAEERGLFSEWLSARQRDDGLPRLWTLRKFVDSFQYQALMKYSANHALKPVSLVSKILQESLDIQNLEATNRRETSQNFCHFLKDIGVESYQDTWEVLKNKFFQGKRTASISPGCFEVTQSEAGNKIELDADFIRISPFAFIKAPGMNFRLRAPRFEVFGSIDLSAEGLQTPTEIKIVENDSESAQILPLFLSRDVAAGPNALSLKDPACVNWANGMADGIRRKSEPDASIYAFCEGEHFFLVHLPIRFAKAPTQPPRAGYSGNPGGHLILSSEIPRSLLQLISYGSEGEPSVSGFDAANGDESHGLLAETEDKDRISVRTLTKDLVGGDRPRYVHASLNYQQFIDLDAVSSGFKFHLMERSLQALHPDDRNKLFDICSPDPTSEQCRARLSLYLNQLLKIVSEPRALAGGAIPDDWKIHFEEDQPAFFSLYNPLKLRSSPRGPEGKAGAKGASGEVRVLKEKE